MAEKRVSEPTTAEEASPGVPRARPAADPPPKKAAKAAKKSSPTKATKTTKAAKTAQPAKKAKATKTTKAAKPAKAAKATKQAKAAATPRPEPAADRSVAPGVPPGAWIAAARELLDQPDQPPRRLAELAVAELGPRAAGWASWLRDTYRDPPAHGLARLAAHEARQAAWALVAAGAAGPIAEIASMPAVAWIRATLVLRIAAAYGHDPSHPDRVDDLLQLLEAPAAGERGLSARLTGLLGPRRRVTLRVAVRLAVRRLPLFAHGLPALIAGDDLRDQLELLAHRAAAHYRDRNRNRRA
ncbi:MAG TPA: hypothetical protein VIL37_10910 [Natronosporangium sp.]